MPDITKIKIGNERERSYKDFPANREFKKRAEDDNPGGGGWPADLPKPSVGGYGYTEQGEQTVITWDGDTEGLVSVSLGGRGAYKISDLIVPNSAIVGMSMTFSNGLTHTETQSDYESSVETGDISDDISALVDSGVIFVRQNGASLFGTTFPETGVYVIKAEEVVFMSTLTYGGDTVHKIDEKYLPEAGEGMMVAHLLHNEDDDTYSCNKTFAELSAAVPNVILELKDSEEFNLVLKPIKYGLDQGFIIFQCLNVLGTDDTEVSNIECYNVTVVEDDSVFVEHYERFFS